MLSLLQEEDMEPVEEGKEAEAEERRWNKRSQQMLAALNRCLQRHDSVAFRQMAPPSTAHSRKQAAAKFYTFLVLKKMEAIDVSQAAEYGDIMISRGPKFELLG
jgi:cohesin complex subunit SCC1